MDSSFFRCGTGLLAYNGFICNGGRFAKIMELVMSAVIVVNNDRVGDITFSLFENICQNTETDTLWHLTNTSSCVHRVFRYNHDQF